LRELVPETQESDTAEEFMENMDFELVQVRYSGGRIGKRC